MLGCLTSEVKAGGEMLNGKLEVGSWASYDMMSSVEKVAPPVVELTIIAGPKETLGDKEYQWWEIDGKKADGEIFAIRMLSDSMTMAGASGAPGHVKRYLLKEGSDRPIEYVDARTGDAYLPKFEFVKELLPQAAQFTQWIKGFAATGTCLGHVISLKETGEGRDWAKWQLASLVKLNPEEIQYVYGIAKDTEGHYIAEGDYHYEPLTKEEFEEEIEAGMNTFWVSGQYEDWCYRKSVFYYKQFPATSKPEIKYPEMLYRANFRGGVVFIDEPAIHYLGSRDDLDKVKRPEEGALLLSKRVEETWNRPSPGKWRQGLLREQLAANGVNLGTMALVDDDHPLWETIQETAFYQLQSGTSGIVHECRYQLKDFIADCEKYLGSGVDASVKDMLLMNYAWMRGAARAFDKGWGVAIYGQCDPEVAPEALTLAYDMGARYLWFWTYDHQHHLPQYMKLKLLNHLKAHKQAHPRGSIKDLLHAPRTAIAIPYGYGWATTFDQMWESKNLNIYNKNAAGIPHRQLVAAIIATGLICSKSGEDYDIVIDAGQDFKGYKRVIRIGLDGQITDSKDTAPGAQVVKLEPKSINVTESKAPEGFDSAKAISVPYKDALKIDGDLSKWSDAKWVTLDQKDQYDGWQEAAGKANTWGGVKDISGSLAFARDTQYLYIAAKVTDDKFSQPFSEDGVWRGDSIQIALDILCDRAKAGYAPDDVEFGLALTPKGPQVYAWRVGVGKQVGLVPDAVLVAKPGASGGMIYEAAIPWSSITPVPSQLIDYIGLNFIINDSDGESRKGYMKLAEGIARDKMTATFALAHLGEIPTEKQSPISLLIDDHRRAVNDGSNWEIALDSWCRDRLDCKLSVTLEHKSGKVAEGIFGVQLPQGRSRSAVTIDKMSLSPGVYQCKLALTGPDTSVESVFPVYILK